MAKDLILISKHEKGFWQADLGLHKAFPWAAGTPASRRSVQRPQQAQRDQREPDLLQLREQHLHAAGGLRHSDVYPWAARRAAGWQGVVLT